MEKTTDAATAARLREEFAKVVAAVKGKGQATIEDPLGEDGVVSVQLESFRATGAGEIHLLKDDGQGNKRWTKYRSFGTNGTDYVEKSSYLQRADGKTEFHKKCAEPQDVVAVVDEAEAEDTAWIGTLA